MGDGIYVVGSFSLSDSYAKKVPLCAIWPGSLLRVNSVVGVVKVLPRGLFLKGQGLMAFWSL